jgi:hypothetical protein
MREKRMKLIQMLRFSTHSMKWMKMKRSRKMIKE